jgi:hypothetical protein
MKTFLIFLVILLCVLIPVFFLVRRQNQRILDSSFQREFLDGYIPNPLPEGPYQGTVQNYRGTWRGKSFDRATATGINVFVKSTSETELIEQYPFKTYRGKGLQDTRLDVFKIDYNVPANPIWLRPIVDEIVETRPGHYLGKMLINIIPGYPFALTWFELDELNAPQ